MPDPRRPFSKLNFYQPQYKIEYVYFPYFNDYIPRTCFRCSSIVSNCRCSCTKESDKRLKCRACQEQ